MSDLIVDFERYLADEPVSAFAEPWSARAARWIKRHRTLVAATASGLLIAAFVSAVAAVLLLDVNRDLVNKKRESEVLRGRTQQALDQATRHLYSHTVGLAHAELTKSNVVRAMELLAECPTEMRNWEWHHLATQIERQKPMATLTEHQHIVRCIAFSPSGASVATSDADGLIVVRDAKSFVEEHRFSFGSQARAIAFSAEDRLWAGGSARPDQQLVGKLVTLDTTSGNKIFDTETGGKGVTSLAIDRQNSQVISAGADGKLVVYDAATFQTVVELKDRNTTLRHVTLCPATDDAPAHLATCGDDGRINVWNWDRQAIVARLAGHKRRSTQAAFDASGTALFSGGHDKMLRVWPLELDQDATEKNEAAAQQVRAATSSMALMGHTDSIQAIATHADRELVATAGYDRTIRIWNVRTHQLHSVLRHHTSHVRCLTFSPDGSQLISGGDERQVYVWNTDQIVSSLPSGEYVAFSKTNNQLASATQRKLTLYDAESKLATPVPLPRSTRITSLDYSSISPLVAFANQSNGISIVDATTATVLRRFESEPHLVHQARFTPDGESIVGCYEDEMIRVWRVSDGSLIREIDSEGQVIRLAFDADQQRLITGYVRGDIAWWDLGEGRCLRRVSGHHPFLTAIATHAERRWLATTGTDGIVKIWTSDSGEFIREMKLGSSWMNCLAFTKDGTRLITGSEQTVTYWDPATGQEITSMTLDRCIHNMSFNPTGEILAVAGESPQIRLWSTTTTR